MKKSFYLLLVSLTIFICQLSICKAQTWKEMMDSTKFYISLENYHLARDYCERALETAEQSLPKNDTSYLQMRKLLSNLYYETRDYKRALQHLKEDSSLFKAAFGIEHPEYADILIALGSCYEKSRKYDEAIQNYLDASQILRLASGERSSQYLLARHKLSVCYFHCGRFNNAVEVMRDLAVLNRAIYGDSSEEYSEDMNVLGILYRNMGRYSDAENMYLQVLKIREKIFGENHPSYGIVLQNIAVLYNNQGRYTESEQYLLKTLKIYKNTIGEKDEEYAVTLDNLASLYLEMGRFKEHEETCKKAVEIFKEKLGEKHPQYALALQNQAVGKLTLNKLDEAEKMFLDALTIFKSYFGEIHNQIALIYSNLMKVYFLKDRCDLMEEYCYKELKIYETILGTDNPIYGNSLAKLADGLMLCGKYLEADSVYQKSMIIIEKYRNDYSLDYNTRLMNFSGLYELLGKNIEALDLQTRALDNYQKIFDRNYTYLSEKEKTQFYNLFNDNLSAYYSIAHKEAAHNEKLTGYMYDLQLAFKSLLLSSSVKTKQRILNSGDTSIISKYKNWISAKEYLINLYKMDQSKIEYEGIDMKKIEEEVNLLEKDISKKSESFSKEIGKKSIKWTEIREQINQYEAAIEISCFNQTSASLNISNPERNLKSGFSDTNCYIALIIKKDSKYPELVILGNSLEFDKKFQQYRNQIFQQRKKIFDPDKIEVSLKDLYNQFWRKINKKLENIKTVYLSPDGVYNSLNLNTLINPETGKYILDEIDLRLVTSTRDLVERNPSQSFALTPPFRKGEISNTAELFGDPQFNLDSTKYTELASRYVADRSRDYHYIGNTLDSATRQGISPLPGTRKEIEKIANFMKEKNWKVNTHLGADALEEAIKSVNSPRVLHIASHGKFLKDVETKEERSFGMETQRFVENPLLRSMLLFSGAENTILGTRGSNHFPSLYEDGLLTAYEAQNLNLDNTELVVLSACETGLGEVRNGEGVYGLQRAFQVAGAKSLIMSLWTVSDQATQELMTNFYNKWLSGKTKRESFREAQQELKKKYPGFYYWGAFVMVGE